MNGFILHLKKQAKATGKWAKRKNLPDGLYETVTAELLGGAQPEPTIISDERPTPATPEVPNVASDTPATPDVPDVPSAVAATPEAPAVPEVPAAPAALPENNQVGEADDELAGILSNWGTNS